MKSTLKLKTTIAGVVSIGSLVLSSLVWAPSAFAGDVSHLDVVKLDPKLTYKAAPDTGETAECDSFIADLIIKFSGQNLISVPMPNEQGANALTVNRTNGLFVSEGFEKMVFLKTGVTLSDAKMMGKLIRLGHGNFGYHQTTKSGIPFAMIFSGFTEQEAADAAGTVLAAANAPIHTRSFVAEVLARLEPSAQAAAGSTCVVPTQKNAAADQAGNLKSIMSGMTAKDMLSSTTEKSVEDCAVGAIAAAAFNSKVGGVVGGAMIASGAAVGLWEGGKALVTDWSGSVAKVSGSVSRVHNFISKVVAEIKADGGAQIFKDAVAKPEMWVGLACGVFTGLTKSAITGILDGSLSAAAERAGIKGLVAQLLKGKAAKATMVAESTAEKAETEALTAGKAASTESKKAEVAPVAAKKAEVASAAPATRTATRSLAESSLANNTALVEQLTKQGIEKPSEVLHAFDHAVVGLHPEADEVIALAKRRSKMNQAGWEDMNKAMLAAAGKSEMAQDIKKVAEIGSLTPKAAAELEVKLANRTSEIMADPTEYKNLHNLPIEEEEKLAVAETASEAEVEKGYAAKTVDEKVGEAGVACGLPAHK